MKSQAFRVLLCFCWLAAAGLGVVALLNFESAPGRASQTPEEWPADTRLALDPARSTLVMFVHPHCPCTRASIGELNRLLARCEGRLTAHVLFLKPTSEPDDWAQTDSWREVAAIPGVAVHADFEGEMARRFGAETSGYVALFDPKGRLLFKGGITAGRGHAGDNAGANVIVAFLEGKNPGLRQTPVYGCSLVETGETQASERAHGNHGDRSRRED